jgi:hypothetical protein
VHLQHVQGIGDKWEGMCDCCAGEGKKMYHSAVGLYHEDDCCFTASRKFPEPLCQWAVNTSSNPVPGTTLESRLAEGKDDRHCDVGCIVLGFMLQNNRVDEEIRQTSSQGCISI